MLERIEPVDYSRDQIVQNFRTLVDSGMTDPGEYVRLDDSRYFLIKEIDRQYEEWLALERSKVEEIGTDEARLLSDLSTLTIHFDAGFNTDQLYLDEVLWFLNKDMQEALEKNLFDVAEQIRLKHQEILATRITNLPGVELVFDERLLKSKGSGIANIVAQIEEYHRIEREERGY
jgi:hypothetical protein